MALSRREWKHCKSGRLMLELQLFDGYDGPAPVMLSTTVLSHVRESLLMAAAVNAAMPLISAHAQRATLRNGEATPATLEEMKHCRRLHETVRDLLVKAAFDRDCNESCKIAQAVNPILRDRPIQQELFAHDGVSLKSYRDLVTGDMVRDMVGDPFVCWRSYGHEWSTEAERVVYRESIRRESRSRYLPAEEECVHFDQQFRVGHAAELCRVAYQEAIDSFATGGRLRRDTLIALSDALVDQGCDDERILNHLRDEKLNHWPGCWVIEAIMGRS